LYLGACVVHLPPSPTSSTLSDPVGILGYSPECAEGEFSEVHIQESEYTYR
jgi:hypothetical protein